MVTMQHDKKKEDLPLDKTSLKNLLKQPDVDMRKAGFLIIVGYVVLLNVFVIKTTPELMFLQFLLIVLVYKKAMSKEFSRHWIPFIAFFFLYELLRGIADDLAPFKAKTLYAIHYLETGILGEMPPTYIRNKFGISATQIDVFVFFYTLFFYYSFFAGFILWLKDVELFETYAKRFILLSFVGLLFFLLFPTSPPWLTALKLGIQSHRPLYEDTIASQFSYASLWNYFLYSNPVAAFPSLHTAWPAFTSVFLIKQFKKPAMYLTLIIPIMIGISVIITWEHYIVDVIFGFALGAAATYGIGRNEEN